MITHGNIEFTMPAAYNENRPGAKVTISYAAKEGASWEETTALAQRAHDFARAEAIRLQLGQSASGPVSVPTEPDGSQTNAPRATTRSRRDPSTIVIPKTNDGPPTAPVSEPTAPVPPAMTAASPTTVPADSGPPTMSASDAAGPATDASQPEQAGDDPSDADLQKAIVVVYDRLKNQYGHTTTPRIMEVVSRHLGGAACPPGRAGQIPQHARQAFLTDLAALA